MSLPVQINKKLKPNTANLRIAENIASNKRQTLRIEKWLNISLVAMEYILYLASFLVLFFYKVVPDHGDFDYNHIIASMKRIPVVDDYALLVGIVFIIYSGIIFQRGHFRINRDVRLIDDLISAMKAVAVAFLIALGFIFFLKTSVVYSRVLIIVWALLMVSVFFIMRIVRLKAQVALHRSNAYNRNVLIIGAGKIGMQIRDSLISDPYNVCKFVGFVDDYKDDENVLGKINNIEYWIQKLKVQEIYITIPSERNVINDLITKVRKYDIEIKIIPEMYELVTSTVVSDHAYDYPCIEIVKTPLRGLNLFLKRTADILLSLFGIIIISPILLITALSIKLDSKGPVFIHQRRIGKNGAPFYMHKFRSMVENADQMKAQLEQFNEADGPAFKMKNDPRITRVGRFIRKYSIDELPQLFNVLKGEMSLIGPRPPLPQEVEQYSDYQWQRLDIRPGITGLWQVSGRSNITFEEWVKLDLYYIEKWSLSLEFKILFKTVPVVLKGEGAY